MKDFADYLSSLPRTPVTEAVTALYEGLTKSDLALGRYLKSFNKGVKVPPIPQGMKPTEQAAYMMLARHPKEVAKLLDIGVTYGIPEDGEDEFDETFAEIDIQDTIKKISGVTSDRSRGAVRCATADIVYVYEHLDNKDELKKAADLYRNGQSDAGYTALKNALGVIDFDYFVNPIVKLLKSEDPYRDSKLFVMNPDIKNHLLRNHWLIHETSVEAGLSIIKTGFDRGNLAGDLAMTTWGKHYQTGDYLFAHDVMDMLSHEDYKSRRFGSYGNFALVFQGSGYKAYHDIDEENQVMFDYHEPKAFFVILHRDDAEEAGFPVKNTEYEDYKYAVYGQGKSGAPAIIFANESAYKCLEWIVQHGASYRNAMFKVSAPAVTEAVNEAVKPLLEGDKHMWIDSPMAMNQKLYDWIRYCADFEGDKIPYDTFDALAAAAKEYRSELNTYKRVIKDGVEIIKDGVEHGVLPKELLDGSTFNDSVFGSTKAYNAPNLEGLVLNILENNQSLSDLVNKCRSFPKDADTDLFKKVFAFGRDDCIDMDVLFALIGSSLLVYNSNDSIYTRRDKIRGRIWHDGLLYDGDALYWDLMLKQPKPEYEEVPIPDNEYKILSLKHRLKGNHDELPRTRKVMKSQPITWNDWMKNPPRQVMDEILSDNKSTAKPFEGNAEMPEHIAFIKQRMHQLGIQ